MVRGLLVPLLNFRERPQPDHLAGELVRRPATASPTSKSVVNKIQPRVQLCNPPPETRGCSCTRPLECFGQLAFQHSDSHELVRNPAILGSGIAFHVPSHFPASRVFCAVVNISLR